MGVMTWPEDRMLSRVAHKIDGVRKEKERLTAAPEQEEEEES